MIQRVLPAPAIIVYGQPGHGKTLDVVSAFPDIPWFGREAALEPCRSWGGFSPILIDPPAASLWDVWELLLDQCTDADLRAMGGVGIDDVSDLADALFAFRALQFREQGVEDMRKVYGAWADEALGRMMALIHRFERLRLPLVMTAHEREYGPDWNGEYVMGGPSFPGRLLTTKLPYACSLVLRAYANPAWLGDWKAVYGCAGPADPQYITKDRWGVAPREGPMNIRAILRLAGFERPYPKGLEAVPVEVQRLTPVLEAARAQGLTEFRAAALAAEEDVLRQFPPHVVWWIIRQACDTVLLAWSKKTRYRIADRVAPVTATAPVARPNGRPVRRPTAAEPSTPAAPASSAIPAASAAPAGTPSDAVAAPTGARPHGGPRRP